MKHSNRLYGLTVTELQQIVNNSSSLCEVVQKLGLSVGGGTIDTLKKRMQLHNINTSTLDANRILANASRLNAFCNSKKIDNNGLKKKLTTNSKCNRVDLKNQLIASGMLINKCYECGIMDMWNGKPIILHIDHINGINTDNRLNNLRILCPNCHSQTTTYCGKNAKKVKCVYKCLDCNTNITRGAKTGYCRKCNQKHSASNRAMDTKIINKQTLIEMVLKYPITKIAFEHTVSDNTIRKWLRKYDLPYKKVDIDKWKCSLTG